VSLAAAEAAGPLAALQLDGGHARITLTRSRRHNALVPELLTDLRAAIAVARQSGARALVLGSAARSFSIGGDIAGFLAHAGSAGELSAYAADLVGELNGAILDLLAFPMPVLTALNGPVTGGSTGLVLASDLVAADPSAFIQPYYVDMGFAPDGGWTALLPDRIGTATALSIQVLNRRISADEALRLGLVSELAGLGAVEAVIAGWLATLEAKDPRSLAATRAGVWPKDRVSVVAARLEAERQRFLALVTHPDTLARMRDFAAGSART
jgi:2-(1,2-epoxy-1,2-dihydrophenyl)acetyl-CoA isomerase